MSRRSTESTSGEQRLKRLRQTSSHLKQVSDPNRMRIVLMLADGARSFGSICEALSGSPSMVGQRLALLRNSGVVLSQRRGKHVFYSLTEIGEELARVAKKVTGWQRRFLELDRGWSSRRE